MVDEDRRTRRAERRFASDRRRCVPIVPEALNLTYHGGDVINTARVVCIF